MKPSKVLKNLRSLLSYEELESEARAQGALMRVRSLHPVQMLEALLATSGQDGGRLADALRYLEFQYGVKVDRSSFYKRLDGTFAAFVHAVMERVMATRVAGEHPELRGRLEGLRDLWAWDSTSVTLRKRLATIFATGGDEGRAGVKLHAAISLRSSAVIRPVLTAQRVADEKAIDLGADLEDVLVLLDRGYSGHRLFAQIAAGQGWFLTRLKDSTNPAIRAVHRGKRKTASPRGMSLDQALESGLLPMDRVVDLDVALSLGAHDSLAARVVGVPVVEDGETRMWWYLTNLPRKQYEPEIIRDLYRLRWQVELLWKQLKGRFRLDDIEAMTEHNVRLVMESALLAHFLSLGVLC
jgi:hypothetical protein